MVMEGDSCCKSRGFESQHRILDVHFSHLCVVNIVLFFEKMKMNEKEAGDGPFKKINYLLSFSSNYEYYSMPRFLTNSACYIAQGK